MTDKAEACDLADRTCEPCRGGIPPLKHEEIEPLAKELGPYWRVVNDHHLERTFSFPDWKSALAFVNRISEPAEKMGHHPNVEFTWGSVTVKIYTHKIDGLHEADFILAARIDRLLTV
jgi:4a-hydroxytetrahydrobiopterin dehydratase